MCRLRCPLSLSCVSTTMSFVPQLCVHYDVLCPSAVCPLRCPLSLSCVSTTMSFVPQLCVHYDVLCPSAMCPLRCPLSLSCVSTTMSFVPQLCVHYDVLCPSAVCPLRCPLSLSCEDQEEQGQQGEVQGSVQSLPVHARHPRCRESGETEAVAPSRRVVATPYCPITY